MLRSRTIILTVAILISLMGILSIYSSAYQKEGRIWELIYKRQAVWFLMGLVFFIFMSNFNYRRLWDMTYVLYAAVLFLLFLVFVLGVVRLGAQRWLKFLWFNFQPSEIAKLVSVIFLARYFSRKSFDDIDLMTHRFGIFRGVVIPFFFIAMPMGLIIEQPDLGSALMLLFIFIAMLYFGGVRLKYIILLLLVFVLSLPVFWHFLKEYQKDRLLVFINPNIDPLGAGYTIIQAKIAIGSGGFFGKGLLGGTQSQLHFLPESHTDFIFSTFTEEWGLFGSSVLFLLYFLLIYHGVRIALRTSDYFGRLLALGISFALGIQVFINIAMNMGFAPVVGLPLPLMSYGGSSIFVTFIALGILVNIDRTRAVF